MHPLYQQRHQVEKGGGFELFLELLTRPFSHVGKQVGEALTTAVGPFSSQGAVPPTDT